ncbi:hypothetical protein [Mycolicibacterium obuense]|uniref:hypothetical protein n=1 Tax=Mycolicibacterium obuense TaxID=1807 RepID=UPI00105E3CEC|nr:hypothetical protein [Mycolicibacterium obuense]
MDLDFDAAELRKNLRSFGRRFDRQIGQTVDRSAETGTAWMKLNVRWRDNTGAARAALHAVPRHHGSTHELLLAHGVHYGIWLETAHNRKNEILSSAQRHIGSQIMADLRAAFRQAAR